MANKVTNCTYDPRDLMQCAICMEPFGKPKCLPCIHTFCLKCLEQFGEDKEPGDTMDCPTCRQVFIIPSGGFKNLPNNIFIEQIAAGAQLLKPGSPGTGVRCECCDNAEANAYCVECVQSMCDACAVIHGRLKATQVHKVVSLDEKEGSQVYTRARPTYCETHPDDQLRLYCCNCTKAICLICAATEHKVHEHADLKTLAKENEIELKSACLALDKTIEIISIEQMSLMLNSRGLLSQIADCERAIKERGAEMKSLVDSQCKKLLDQLEKIKIGRVKRIQTRKDEVDRQLLLLSSFKTYVEELTTKGSACAISQSAKDLLARANELQTAQAELSKGSLRPDRVTLKLEPIPDIIIGPKGIGSIAINDNTGYGTERTLAVVGLDNGERMSQCVCHISLECADTVSAIDSTPAVVDREAAACAMGDTLYAVGIGRACNELWRWNATYDWLRCKDMMAGRRRHCVAVFDSELYVLGGFHQVKETTLSIVEAYNTQTQKWSAAGQLKHAVRSAACVTYKNSIYVFGGLDAHKKDVSLVQVYNTQKQFTLLSTTMPRAYGLMRAVVCENSAILLGRAACFIYNFDSEKWLEKDLCKTDVDHFGLVIDKQTLYIVGGGLAMLGKDNKSTWKLSDEVRCLSVRDIISNKRDTGWEHHATLPQPGLIYAFSAVAPSLATRTEPKTQRSSSLRRIHSASSLPVLQRRTGNDDAERFGLLTIRESFHGLRGDRL